MSKITEAAIKYDAKFFNWDRKTKRAYGEVPSLTHNSLTGRCDLPLFGMLYDDAVDIGFCVVNGENTTSWVVRDYNRRDGDILSYTLIPTTETTRKFPRLNGWEMLIVND